MQISIGNNIREILSTVTQRGQVTIPADVRKILGVKPRDKVAFTIEDGRVGLMPAKFTLETVLGSVKPATKTEDLKVISQDAKGEKAEREVEGWHKR